MSQIHYVETSVEYLLCSDVTDPGGTELDSDYDHPEDRHYMFQKRNESDTRAKNSLAREDWFAYLEAARDISPLTSFDVHARGPVLAERLGIDEDNVDAINYLENAGYQLNFPMRLPDSGDPVVRAALHLSPNPSAV